MSNIVIPSLDLQLEEPGHDVFQDALLPIAKPALESGREDLIRAAAEEIVRTIGARVPHFYDSIDPFCMNMAEQIPYNSEKMLDVVMLLEFVHAYPRSTIDPTPAVEREKDPLGYLDVARQAFEFWDGPNNWEEGSHARYISFHAFISHLYCRGIITGSTAPVLSLVDALEKDVKGSIGSRRRETDDLPTRETLVMGASQYIYRWGQGLLKECLTKFNSASPSFDNLLYGYTGMGAQGLEKWHVWRDSLRKIAAGGWDEDEKQISTEAKEFFTKVADSMDGTEAEVTSAEKSTDATATFTET